MAKGSGGKKIANNLVALSSAAVLAVYAAGYERTKTAADRLEAQAAQHRRPRAALPPAAASPILPEPAPPPEPAHATAPLEAKLETPARPAAVKPGEILSQAPATPAGAPVSAPAPAGVAPPAAPSAPVPAAAALPLVPPAPPAPPVTAKLNTPLIAPPPPPPPPPPAPPAAPAPSAKWKDGTYYGWGSCPHGDIQAEVVIERGRIAVASIHKCRTRYSCSVIDRLPPEVALRQSPEVDYVSGATESADAFYSALVDALNQAK